MFPKDLGRMKSYKTSDPVVFPTLYDNCITLNIADLNSWGYLIHNQRIGGIIRWSEEEKETISIFVRVNTKAQKPYIEVDYKFNEKPISYIISLVSVPSNLGKGFVWYFLCPETKKRCRKLYLGSEKFLHREAFKKCIYEKQTRSKKWRKVERVFDNAFNADQAYLKINSKHFKTHYAGKPTKRYLRLIKQISECKEKVLRDIKWMF